MLTSTDHLLDKRAHAAGNLFHNNEATITGGAIAASYCGHTQPVWKNNVFRTNTASQFPGTIGLNAQTLPALEPASVGPVPDGAGCPRPKLTSNSFGKSDIVFSPPWYVVNGTPNCSTLRSPRVMHLRSHCLTSTALLQVLPLSLDKSVAEPQSVACSIALGAQMAKQRACDAASHCDTL